MKGKIDSRGFLHIYRGDSNPKLYQNQVCPFSFTNNGNAKHCGQWCPHFGEPKKDVAPEEFHNDFEYYDYGEAPCG